MTSNPAILVYAAPLLVIWALYLGSRWRSEKRNRAIQEAAARAGHIEPVSLHPLIDTNICTGCGSCAKACPAGRILGIIQGKAQLIDPGGCIGHGACKLACPMGAISLVFGSEKRGVDIPLVSPSFETNAPGLFIAGELGGMGLIRNAIEQGRRAVASVRKLEGIGQAMPLDLVIVGAGPAGFSASLAAMEHKLRSVTVEQDTLGGTVAHYPRGKLVMTSPAVLPLFGKVKMTETNKEELLEFWHKVEKRTGVQINYGERVETISGTDKGFEVKTTGGTYRTRAVLLAIGRRGTPRKLDVPGEDLSKVVYRLIDPVQYRGKNVLVVGGGDSALEAASSVAEEPETIVTIAYRSDDFSRAKPKNQERIIEVAKAGRLRVLMKSQVKRIAADEVEIDCEGKLLKLRNDAVIVCAGGILPTAFLKSIGVAVETKYGTA